VRSAKILASEGHGRHSATGWLHREFLAGAGVGLGTALGASGLERWLEDPARPPSLYEYHVDSYWFETSGRRDDPLRPPLRGDARIDVAIVGGGFTGLATAIALARRQPGRRVLLLEGARAKLAAMSAPTRASPMPLASRQPSWWWPARPLLRSQSPAPWPPWRPCRWRSTEEWVGSDNGTSARRADDRRWLEQDPGQLRPRARAPGAGKLLETELREPYWQGRRRRVN
jgi:hypothetical protein